MRRFDSCRGHCVATGERFRFVALSATRETEEQPDDDDEHTDQNRNIPEQVGVCVQVQGKVHTRNIGIRGLPLEQ